MGICASRQDTNEPMTLHPGLPNINNNCFLNALLQALHHSQAFSALLDSPDTNPVLRDAFKSLFTDKRASIQSILSLVPEVNDDRPHCAHSLFYRLMGVMAKKAKLTVSIKNRRDEELIVDWRTARGPLLFDSFGCLQQLAFTCSGCPAGWKSGSFSYSISLPVTNLFRRNQAGWAFSDGKYNFPAIDIPGEAGENEDIVANESVDIRDCFAYLQRKILMKAEDSLLCHGCHRDTQHYKTAQIAYAPKVLVLHLQRYNAGEKNNQLVAFPDKLRLGNVMQLEGKYHLHAVIHHYGTLTSGHYWTDVRVDGQWQRFNDLNTSLVSWSEVVKETAYVLFYTKKEGKSRLSSHYS